MIQSDEMVRPEVYADALAIIAELEAQVHDLERDKTEAVELARRWRERAERATGQIEQARLELLALRHRDLLGRAAGREMVGPLHLDRWAELEAAGWVVREGEVFVLTAEGERVWRVQQ